MSKNPFAPEDIQSSAPNRNLFDRSFVSQNTCNYGDLKVVFCKEAIPGDSVRIKPTVKVRSQPIVFPIGTRMRAYLNYYVVRHRTLWKDWKDFITRTRTDLVKPWLKLNNSRAKQMISTGSLGDDLGVPSTISGNFPVLSKIFVSNFMFIGPKLSSTNYSTTASLASYSSYVSAIQGLSYEYFVGNYLYDGVISDLSTILGFARILHVENDILELPSNFVSSDFNLISSPAFDCYMLVFQGSDVNTESLVHSYSPIISADSEGRATISIDVLSKNLFSSGRLNNYRTDFILIYIPVGQNISNIINDTYYSVVCSYFGRPNIEFTQSIFTELFVNSYISGILDSTDDRVISSNCFVGNNPTIPLDALPFRAYEMVYNYFYRNDQNNPYMLDENGVPTAQYNRFIPSDDGGPDVNLYVTHRRNWELDAYTSAVPSPQFGVAPLVGITYSGGTTADLSFQGTYEGVSKDYKVTVGLNGDGDIVNIVDYDKDVPSGNLRVLADLASYGISINDFRNVNSMQRYLENMLRKGSLRYHDQLQAHFGVSPDFPDVDVPQYIGGVSSDLIVSQVTNLAEGAAPLGDVSGQIDALFSSEYNIDFYAHEHCFIMGILTIVPIPSYSQVLSKMFTRYSAFDYFTPEFSKIGYVPIYRSELMPLQSSDVSEVFGYQKAWYDYMSSLDEIHGDFRTTLRDFTLTRVFSQEPQLNADFTIVDPDSLNNIFAVDSIQDKYGSSDKFMIWVYNDCKYKSPIPRHGVPSLE